MSFCSTMRSAIATLSAVSRSVIEFSALLTEMRVVWRSARSALATSVTSPFERKNVRMTRSSYVLRFCGVSAAIRIVLLVDDLVEVVLLAHQRLERLLELDVRQDDRDVVVLQLRVEDDVDAGRVGERAVDLLDRLRLREVQVDRPVARGLEHRAPSARAPVTFFLSVSILDSALRSASCLASLLPGASSSRRGVVVGRIEQDGLLELDDGEVGAARAAVDLALLEVELGGLDAGPGERRLVAARSSGRARGPWRTSGPRGPSGRAASSSLACS